MLMVDFTMRLLVIEKKSAASYSEDLAVDDDTQRISPAKRSILKPQAKSSPC